jgi:hypothetical protein
VGEKPACHRLGYALEGAELQLATDGVKRVYFNGNAAVFPIQEFNFEAKFLSKSKIIF